MDIKKVKYHRLYEDIIEQIENMILNGTYQPGDVLPTERELAQAFGVSRGTLREAFRILEREGLIETRPGGGRYVKSVKHHDEIKRILDNIEKAAILDLLEARLIFESGIVELASQRATEQDLEEIERALEQWRITDRETGQRKESDFEFHLAIAKATQNIVLVNLFDLHMDLIQKTVRKTITREGRQEEIYREHLAIYEAIKERDGNKAKQALQYHLNKVKENIQKMGS